MTKFIKGSKQISSKDGKTVLDFGNNRLKAQNPTSGIMSTYWIGELEANLVGGTLDGVTYGTYILTIRLHHTFSEEYPDLTPLYEFWIDYQETYERIIQAMTMGDVAHGGVYTLEAYHQMINSKFTPGARECLEFVWIVTRTSGSVIISPQTVRLIPHLKFFSEPLTIVETTGQGGGGGILAEDFDFYV